MDEGLLFWLVIVAIAVLQGIGQRKKKPGQRRPGSSPAPPDPSREPVESQAGDSEAGQRRDSSEGLVPADVWEEILGLARGEPSKPRAEDRDVSSSETVPESGSGFDSEPAPEVVPAAAPMPAPAPEPRSTEATATLKRQLPLDTTTKLPPETEPVAIPVRRGRTASGPGRALRTDLFGTGSLEDLQKAVILREVLGPPVGFRADSGLSGPRPTGWQEAEEPGFGRVRAEPRRDTRDSGR